MDKSAQNNTPPSQTPISESGFLLIIERGVSKFPTRPISYGRFLIGAGSNCHLQLGGDMPLLHSIILPEQDHLWIDAVSSVPALMVNGQSLRDGELHRGDVIEIGEFVFCVDYRQPAMQSSAHAVSVPIPATPPSGTERNAKELLDLLEQDLAELNQFADSRHQAAAALQQAATNMREFPQVPWQADQRASVLQMLAQLHDRAKALDQREAALEEHARRLAQSQADLQRQLELLLNRSPKELPTGIAEAMLSKDEDRRKSA